MKEAHESMKTKDTWKVVYFPVNNHPPYINNRWVLVKKAVTGEPLRFKARIVLLGCHQHGYGGEVYAPTAHIVTVRMIIALSIQHNETLYKLDIKDAAFPQCEEKSELYTTPIEGFPLFWPRFHRAIDARTIDARAVDAQPLWTTNESRCAGPRCIIS